MHHSFASTQATAAAASLLQCCALCNVQLHTTAKSSGIPQYPEFIRCIGHLLPRVGTACGSYGQIDSGGHFNGCLCMNAVPFRSNTRERYTSNGDVTQITPFHSTLALSANILSDGQEPLGPSFLRDANYMKGGKTEGTERSWDGKKN